MSWSRCISNFNPLGRKTETGNATFLLHMRLYFNPLGRKTDTIGTCLAFPSASYFNPLGRKTETTGILDLLWVLKYFTPLGRKTETLPSCLSGRKPRISIHSVARPRPNPFFIPATIALFQSTRSQDRDIACGYGYIRLDSFQSTRSQDRDRYRILLYLPRNISIHSVARPRRSPVSQSVLFPSISIHSVARPRHGITGNTD